MAPYMNIMRGMTREEKQVVVMFLKETMDEQPQKSNRDIIREKYSNLEVSPELKQMRGCIKLTDEDLKDERTQYIRHHNKQC